jgi:predicted GNAT family acetyltransferase
MVALTDLVFPGFFRPGTIRMGDYFGIFHNGLLIAMAGERLAFGSHREISAVCTHPDHQRRGHALKLVKFLMERILRRGERPFLHVGVQNVRALPLYQNVGFVSENIAEINFYRRLDK